MPEKIIDEILKAWADYVHANPGQTPKIKLNPSFLHCTLLYIKDENGFPCVFLTWEDAFKWRFGEVPPKPWALLGMEIIEDDSVKSWELQACERAI